MMTGRPGTATIVLRQLMGWLVGVWCWRPGRAARARRLLADPTSKVVLMRIDLRVGEALLMTPLLEALAPRRPTVVLHQKCVRVLEGHPLAAEVVGFDRRLWWLGPLAPGMRALRRLTEGAVVVNCAAWSEYSGTAALVARLGSPNAAVVGPCPGPNRLLADVRVPPRTDTTSEVGQRLHLLSPLGVDRATAPLSFRAPRATTESTALRAALPSPYAVVNPGGRLDWRRVPEAVFRSVCEGLVARGVRPVVTWGPGERPLAERVAPSPAYVAPATSLDELAHLMTGASVCVVNNTGPMHLSVAVGAPTVGLFLHMPMARWGHQAPPHTMVDLTPSSEDPAAMARVTLMAVDATLTRAK